MRPILRRSLVGVPMLLAACRPGGGARLDPGAAGATLAIEGVTVVDVEAGRGRPGQTVLVAGRRIAAVGPARSVRVPAGARRVDGRGRYLVPGLWDMHVHAFIPEVLGDVYLAHGITGVRDMGDVSAPLARWRDSVRAGSRAGPRIVFPGPLLDGIAPARWAPHFVHVPDTAAARRVVDSVAALGASFVKVYTMLRPEVFRAIHAAASRHRLPIAGHVPYAMTVAEAAPMMASQEHLYGVLLAASTRERELRDSLLALLASTGDGLATYRRAFEQSRALLDSFDPARARSAYDALARAGTRVTPTLVVLEPPSRLGDPALTSDPALAYIPRFLRPFMTSDSAMRAGGRGVDPALERRLFDAMVRTVGEMHRAGVRILAGSDSPNPFTPPGASFHRELALLVRAGLTPAEALRAATLEPAAFLGVRDSLGTIAPGKLADLVLLGGDPLADIRHVSRIEGVVAGGRFLGADTLRAMLQRARGER